MLNKFDGTEELTYTPEFQKNVGWFKPERVELADGPVIRFSRFAGKPPHEVVDCIAEVRNVQADVLRAKEARA